MVESASSAMGVMTDSISNGLAWADAILMAVSLPAAVRGVSVYDINSLGLSARFAAVDFGPPLLGGGVAFGLALRALPPGLCGGPAGLICGGLFSRVAA